MQQSNIPKVRVLVVDDDLRISELHKRFVEKDDRFEVIGLANTIADAQEMVEVLEPDLVLLDLFFPVDNGMDLLHQLRLGKRACDVILITAAREIGFLQEALRGGVFDYIVKPVFLPRLQEALKKYYDYFSQTYRETTIDQEVIDRLLHTGLHSETTMQIEMPKGIDTLTLAKVRTVFDTAQTETLNAEEVGKQIGVSRSTARRYLEYLVSENFLTADLLYGAVGRPERRYFRRG